MGTASGTLLLQAPICHTLPCSSESLNFLEIVQNCLSYQLPESPSKDPKHSFHAFFSYTSVVFSCIHVPMTMYVRFHGHGDFFILSQFTTVEYARNKRCHLGLQRDG